MSVICLVGSWAAMVPAVRSYHSRPGLPSAAPLAFRCAYQHPIHCQHSQRVTKGRATIPYLRGDDLLKLPVYPSVSGAEGRQVFVGTPDLLAHMM